MSNWPKVSVVHLNQLFVYTYSLFQLLQMQQQHSVLGCNCKRWEGQGSQWGTQLTQRWLQSLQFEDLSAWKGSWPRQDRSLSLPCGKQVGGQRSPLSAHIALLRPNSKLSPWNTPQLQRDVSGTKPNTSSPRLDSPCQWGWFQWHSLWSGFQWIKCERFPKHSPSSFYTVLHVLTGQKNSKQEFWFNLCVFVTFYYWL